MHLLFSVCLEIVSRFNCYLFGDRGETDSSVVSHLHLLSFSVQKAVQNAASAASVNLALTQASVPPVSHV